jgi:hypothetical protein
MAGFRPASTLLTHPCRTVSGSFGTRHIPGRCCSQPWHGTGCSVGPATGTAALPSVTRDGATAASSCYSSAGPCPGYLDRGMARRRPRRLGPGMGGVRAGSVHRQCSLQPVSHQAGQIGGRRRLHHDRVAAAHPPPRGPAPLRDLADREPPRTSATARYWYSASAQIHRRHLAVTRLPEPPGPTGARSPRDGVLCQCCTSTTAGYGPILLPPCCHPSRRPDRRCRRSGPDLHLLGSGGRI